MTPAQQTRAGACAAPAALPVQLSWWFPHLHIPELRGDFGTRTGKLCPGDSKPGQGEQPQCRGVPIPSRAGSGGACLGREGGDK